MGQTESSEQSTAQVVKGTISPADPFYKEKDATDLYTAMEGFGTDEDAISTILTKRSNMQRQAVVAAFKTKYKKSLVDCLKSELSGCYRDTVNAMIEDPPIMLARFINKVATCVIPNSHRTIDLLEIIFPLHPQEITAVAAAYKTTFDADMAADVTSNASGPFKDVLVSLLGNDRDTAVTQNSTYANQDAKFFAQTPPEQWQLPNDRVLELFSKASLVQLRATFMQADMQFKAEKKSFEEIVQASSMDCEQKAGFLVIVKCVCQPIAFYAGCLYTSMKGLGTSDDKLIRIIVGRSEIDLANIKTVFKQTYNISLKDMVSDDTSGDYKVILLGIIGTD